jgi:LEA14-like dessication related protein
MGVQQSTRRGKGRWPFVVLALVCVVGVAILACGTCATQWFGQKQVDRIDIALVEVGAVLNPPFDMSLEFTAELTNANPTWVDVDRIDYCLEVNDSAVHCGLYPESGQRLRIVADDKSEASLKLKPTLESVRKLLESAGRGNGLPEARLTGRATVSSPVGSLEFDFKTQPIRFDIRRVGIKVELPTGE